MSEFKSIRVYMSQTVESRIFTDWAYTFEVWMQGFGTSLKVKCETKPSKTCLESLLSKPPVADLAVICSGLKHHQEYDLPELEEKVLFTDGFSLIAPQVASTTIFDYRQYTVDRDGKQVSSISKDDVTKLFTKVVNYGFLVRNKESGTRSFIDKEIIPVTGSTPNSLGFRGRCPVVKEEDRNEVIISRVIDSGTEGRPLLGIVSDILLDRLCPSGIVRLSIAGIPELPFVIVKHKHNTSEPVQKCYDYIIEEARKWQEKPADTEQDAKSEQEGIIKHKPAKLLKEELSKQQRTIEIAKSQSIHAPKEKFRQSNTFKFVVIPLLGIIVMAIVGIPAWISLFRKAGQHSIIDTNIFADVSKKGVVLRSNNFPWEIRKSNDQVGNILYTIVDRRGDSTAVSVVPDNPKYTVYQSFDGMVIKFTCSEEEISNFTINLKY